MLTSLKIMNFRKLKNVEIQFKDNLLITGKNAQGKTSIAEALYFCAFLYSPNTTKKEELITFNQPYSLINVKREAKIKCMLTKHELKLQLNDHDVKKPSEIIGQFNVVYLNPKTINLVEGSSGIRRKFINAQMSQENTEHLEILTNYNKLIKQKRKLIKNNQIDQTYLEIINNELEILNEIIVKSRCTYLEKLINSAEKIVNWLSNEQEKISFKYIPTPKTDSILTKEQQYKNIMWGNHLDQIELYINGLNVRQYGSQGQKRSLAIALNIAQMELLYAKKKAYPIVIIDDIFSELDHKRQQKLYTLVSKKSQLILITPNIKNIDKNIVNDPKLQQITIDNGEIL